MPIFPWPAQGDVPPVGDPAFDALLSGDPPPDDAATGLRRAAEVIAALNDAPVTSELAALPGAMAVFRSEIGRPGQPARSRRRRHAWLGSRVSAKLAAAATAAAVTLGGAVAAAYAGVLPASVQELAHHTLGAPPAHPPAHPAHPVTPAGPRPAGHAGYGLCTAYEHLKAHGFARAHQRRSARAPETKPGGCYVPGISAVVPAYNEAAGIAATVNADDAEAEPGPARRARHLAPRRAGRGRGRRHWPPACPRPLPRERHVTR